MGKILIVEDDRLLLEFLKHSVETEGHMTVTAEDGASARKWLKEMRFDLVLLDLVLPDMNGMQICEEIKQNPKLRTMPVVILTGDSSNEAKIKAGLEVKADLFLNKPISPDELRTALKGVLKAYEKKKLMLRTSFKDRVADWPR